METVYAMSELFN